MDWNSDDAFKIIGIMFTSIGTVGLNFFEENPTGKTLLDSSTEKIQLRF